MIKEIREGSELKRAIIFVLTTSSDPEDLRKAYDYNISGYMTKMSTNNPLNDKLDVIREFLAHIEFSPA